MIRIERRVNELLSFGELDAEVRLGERAANADDQVGVGDKMVHWLRHRIATRAERQGMVLGERALAAQAGGDRRTKQFGKGAKLWPCLGPLHARASVDQRS